LAPVCKKFIRKWGSDIYGYIKRGARKEDLCITMVPVCDAKILHMSNELFLLDNMYFGEDTENSRQTGGLGVASITAIVAVTEILDDQAILNAPPYTLAAMDAAFAASKDGLVISLGLQRLLPYFHILQTNQMAGKASIVA
jgi:hypothetical protein